MYPEPNSLATAAVSLAPTGLSDGTISLSIGAGRTTPGDPASFDDAKTYDDALIYALRKVKAKEVVEVPKRFLKQVAATANRLEATRTADAEPGKLHQLGRTWRVPFLLFGLEARPAIAVLDTGATPTLCKASALEKIDPQYKEKMIPFDGELEGLDGNTRTMGIYPASLLFPHWDLSIILPKVEFIVGEYSLPYDFIVGQDTGRMYAFNFMRPKHKPPYLQIGPTTTKFHVGEGAPANLTAIRVVPKTRIGAVTSMAFNTKGEGEAYPSDRADILHKDFLALFDTAPTASAEFDLAIEKANIYKDLTPEQKVQLRTVMRANEGAFALDGVVYERPHLGAPLHLEITLPDPVPRNLKRPSYPASEKARRDMVAANQVQLDQGVSVKSESPFSAATFMVYQKIGNVLADAKARMVHDYRFMNKFLKVLAWPIPHIWTSLVSVEKSKYMTSIDVVSAFHCMRLDDESRKYTAYSTPFGLFEYVTGCFGLASMPSEFQMRMEDLFSGPLNQRWFLAYIDDGLISSSTWEAHLWQLFVILRILNFSGCRIALKKCHFAVPEVKYLGHKLSGLTLGLDEGRVLAINGWETPKDRKDVESLIGFLGYHRNFIPNYSQIVAPLQRLIPLANVFEWTKEHDTAFTTAKEAMAAAATLYKPDWDKPFMLYTDASFQGLGAGLYQMFTHNGRECEVPLVFISRQLAKGELRYGATQLECLCVVWALEKLHFYLHGAQFTIVTDCDALKTLLTAKWVNRHMIRWQVGIQDYHGQFDIVHRAGISHANADGPSRNALPNTRDNPASDLRDIIAVGAINDLPCYEMHEIITVGATYPVQQMGNKRAVCIRPPPQPRSAQLGTPASFEMGGISDSATVGATGTTPTDDDTSFNYTEEYLHDIIGVAAIWAELDTNQLANQEGPITVGPAMLIRDPKKKPSALVSMISPEIQANIIQGYQDNPTIQSLLHVLQKEDVSLLSKDAHQRIKSGVTKGSFNLLWGVIYFARWGPIGPSAVLVVDKPTQLLVLDASHDELMAGHFGPDRTYDRLQTFAWWPGMRKDVVDYCNSCKPCNKTKRLTGLNYGLLQYIESPTIPFETINMDFVTGLPPSGPLSYDSVLVVEDRCTRMTCLLPCHKTIDAEGTAMLFDTYIICRHGLPNTIISDRDPKFTSAFWKELMKILKIKIAMTTAHNPQADGLAERKIKTMEESIRIFANHDSLDNKTGINRDWSNGLAHFEYAYNSTKHASTGLAPFVAYLGRIPQNSMTLLAKALKLPPSLSTVHTSGYARHATLTQAKAHEAIVRSHESAKRRYDQKHRESPLKVGDWAYLSSKHFHFADTYEKLKPCWLGPYEVTAMVGPNAAKLDLPPPLNRRHPVFSVRYLKPGPAPDGVEQFPGRREYFSIRPKSGLVNEKYSPEDIEMIVNERRFKNPDGEIVQQFLVRWKSYGYDSDCWVSERQMVRCDELKRDYRSAKRNEYGALQRLVRQAHADDSTEGDNTNASDVLEESPEDEYEIEKIVGQRKRTDGQPGQLEYKVRWLGYGPTRDEWFQPEHLTGASDLLADWQQKHTRQRRVQTRR